MADYTPRLKSVYKDNVRGAMKEEFSYKNDMMIPRLDKIVLNMGVGEAVADSKKIRSAEADMTAIAGQKAVITKAKNSIAGFKVREDMPLGVKVTLRGDRMYEFLDRLVNVAMPRVRDFRGVSAKSHSRERSQRSPRTRRYRRAPATPRSSRDRNTRTPTSRTAEIGQSKTGRPRERRGPTVAAVRVGRAGTRGEGG